MLRRKKGAVTSPSSSRMMAGSEIPDGSSLMSSQLHVGAGIRPSSFSSTFFISSPPEVSLSPALSCAAHLILISLRPPWLHPVPCVPSSFPLSHQGLSLQLGRGGRLVAVP